MCQTQKQSFLDAIQRCCKVLNALLAHVPTFLIHGEEIATTLHGCLWKVWIAIPDIVEELARKEETYAAAA